MNFTIVMTSLEKTFLITLHGIRYSTIVLCDKTNVLGVILPVKSLII